jgi:hypothetical protein
MPQQQPLLNLIEDLTGDLHDPSLLWQLAAIAISVVIGFGWRAAEEALRAAGWPHRRAGLRRREFWPRDGAAGGDLPAGAVAGAWREPPPRQLDQGGHADLRFAGGDPLHLLSAAPRVRAQRPHHQPTMLAFEKVFQLLVWLAFVLYITGLWVDVFAFMDGTVLPIGKYKVSIADILQASASVVVLLMLALWAGARWKNG